MNPVGYDSSTAAAPLAEHMTEQSIEGFAEASRRVLKFLHERLGFGLWMVTRTEGNNWIVLHSEDHGYGVTPGSVFRWADSFCSEMVRGNGPRIAPDSARVPIYAAAPIGRQVPIRAYVGVPITFADGSLFGTLCAIDPSPAQESLLEEQALLDLQGELLSTILQLELRSVNEARRAERLEIESLTDAMTGLHNRRGWDVLMAGEEERCQRYGHPAAVFVIDLNHLKQVNDTYGHDAGDKLIIKAAEAMRSVARTNDVVARLGGDELALLAVECDLDGARKLAARLALAFEGQDISASIGMAMRDPVHDLGRAWKEADQRMYERKRQYRQST